MRMDVCLPCVSGCVYAQPTVFVCVCLCLCVSICVCVCVCSKQLVSPYCEHTLSIKIPSKYKVIKYLGGTHH